jgi:hypothetical protein
MFHPMGSVAATCSGQRHFVSDDLPDEEVSAKNWRLSRNSPSCTLNSQSGSFPPAQCSGLLQTLINLFHPMGSVAATCSGQRHFVSDDLPDEEVSAKNTKLFNWHPVSFPYQGNGPIRPTAQDTESKSWFFSVSDHPGRQR